MKTSWLLFAIAVYTFMGIDVTSANTLSACQRNVYSQTENPKSLAEGLSKCYEKHKTKMSFTTCHEMVKKIELHGGHDTVMRNKCIDDFRAQLDTVKCNDYVNDLFAESSAESYVGHQRCGTMREKPRSAYEPCGKVFQEITILKYKCYESFNQTKLTFSECDEVANSMPFNEDVVRMKNKCMDRFKTEMTLEMCAEASESGLYANAWKERHALKFKCLDLLKSKVSYKTCATLATSLDETFRSGTTLISGSASGREARDKMMITCYQLGVSGVVQKIRSPAHNDDDRGSSPDKTVEPRKSVNNPSGKATQY